MDVVETHISSIAQTNLWISGSLPLKLPVKFFLEKFLLAQNNRRKILGVVLGVIYSKKNRLQPTLRQKTTQLLSDEF